MSVADLDTKAVSDPHAAVRIDVEIARQTLPPGSSYQGWSTTRWAPSPSALRLRNTPTRIAEDRRLRLLCLGAAAGRPVAAREFPGG